MVMSDEQCAQLFDAIVEMNKNMEGVNRDVHWLTHNAENQIEWCRRNEDRLRELEKWSSKSRGYFKIIGRVLSILVGAIVTGVVLFYQIFRGG